jgi:CBS domain-containing protein
MTTLLVVILHDSNLLPKLMAEWKQVGVPGATILPSVGSYQTENWLRRIGLEGLARLFDQDTPAQRTLLSIIDDPDLLERAISAADKAVKGFDRPHSGIMFTLPIGQVLGLRKWRRDPDAVLDEGVLEKDLTDRDESNLTAWLREEIKTHVKASQITRWERLRSSPVSLAVQVLNLMPNSVPMDSPLPAVLDALLANPAMPEVYVVNREERLMGLIDKRTLSEILFVPLFPEAFTNNPEDYEHARRFSNPNRIPLAADVISDAVCVTMDDPVEVVFNVMRSQKLTGLPVVDEHYRLAGYINLLGLLAFCFRETGSDSGEE